jgi:hypothetical protein
LSPQSPPTGLCDWGFLSFVDLYWIELSIRGLLSVWSVDHYVKLSPPTRAQPSTQSRKNHLWNLIDYFAQSISLQNTYPLHYLRLTHKSQIFTNSLQVIICNIAN